MTRGSKVSQCASLPRDRSARLRYSADLNRDPPATFSHDDVRKPNSTAPHGYGLFLEILPAPLGAPALVPEPLLGRRDLPRMGWTPPASPGVRGARAARSSFAHL